MWHWGVGLALQFITVALCSESADQLVRDTLDRNCSLVTVTLGVGFAV